MNLKDFLQKKLHEQRDPKKPYPHDYILKYSILPLIPRWILPNHFTILRFILTPIVFWLLITQNYTMAIPFFLFTAFTDAIDGSLARVRHQITNWGTFYDPVADKILISGSVLLIVFQHINPYFALLIILVELLIVSGAILRRKQDKRIISANIFGKTKMVLQVAAVTFLLIAIWAGADLFINVSVATFSLAITFAILSLFSYGL
ncbi:hypothetical protein CO172_01075 [Candidatus Uhrbacteria bacterium CG_4_9_14_3_um_filter_36_7]|uniref:CDP-diacylglycerol--glycerol-3-phosphate 3-phosphatidyltransferase n=1 Tax=Candidatus Uhrbacteria bacterium CG_4_9_14_3_um_filter_36_7 TaxID=1975033 RepID=A0A2M7XHY5_9BACT|nr:MAG: hypothetical protein CO172_01075 [Candidatus Uhrbacteria bacterium CG_4_9_14_3_um_filter_36_7]